MNLQCCLFGALPPIPTHTIFLKLRAIASKIASYIAGSFDIGRWICKLIWTSGVWAAAPGTWLDLATPAGTAASATGESARLKLIRATKHLHAIESCVGAYSRRNPCKPVEHSDGKETLDITEQPPSDIAVLAGEMVYQLRSALDHMAFDLVKFNASNIQLPADWEEQCCFPLRLRVPKETPVYNCFSRILPGISEQAFAFIERVQPYYRVGTGNALRLLAELSNVDKHRHLNVTVPKAAQYEQIKLTGGWDSSSVRGGLKHGGEVYPPSARNDMERKFLPYITFDEPTVGQGPDTLEVEHVLKVILDQVETVIVPTFEKLLHQP